MSQDDLKGTAPKAPDESAPKAPAESAPKAPDKPAPPAAEAKPAQPQVPSLVSPLPLLGGRMTTVIGVLFAIAFVSWNGMNSCVDRTLYPDEPKPAAEWTVGTEANVELTLITADARRLNCAHDQVVEGGFHCGYTANKRSWRRQPGSLLDDNDEKVIQPYRTADTNALILVAGLWAQPAVAMRLHREPPSVYDTKKQIRFVAYCRVKFVGELQNASLRWDTGAKWTDNQTALVAQPLHCTLEAPES